MTGVDQFFLLAGSGVFAGSVVGGVSVLRLAARLGAIRDELENLRTDLQQQHRDHQQENERTHRRIFRRLRRLEVKTGLEVTE